MLSNHHIPLLPSSPFAFSLSQHQGQGLSQWNPPTLPYYLISYIIIMVHFFRINEPTLIHNYWLKSILYLDLLSFYLSFHFAAPGYHITLSCCVSLGSLWLWESQTCFWWSWQFWGILVRYSIECPSVGNPYHLTGVMGLGRKTTKVKCHFHHTVSVV